MRVLLVSPTAVDAAGRPVKQSRVHLPGLTLPMLAAVTPPEVHLRAVIETSQAIPWDEPWDLVGFTGMGSGITRAWALADAFRARGVKTVIGGIAATLGDPESTLAHADALVTGEAEETWPRVLADAAAGRLQRLYRPARTVPVETLPEPRYDVLDRRAIGRWLPVQATRGCPFTCSFCSITAFFEQRYRKRPVDQVLRDVRLAKARGCRHIAFVDDNIGVDWDYAGALWEALIPERIEWMSQCSLHIADQPAMLALARRSGCRLLSFGIESVNAESLAAIDKAWNRPGRYPEAIARIRGAGIEVSTEMIVGMDGDDDTVFARTEAFVMANAIAVPRVHILTPIPGTPLHAELRAADRLLDVAFTGYTGGRVVFQPRHLAPEVLEREYWRLYERLFSWRAILHRLWRNRARLGPYLRGMMLAVNLHYRANIRRRVTPGIV